MFMVCFPAVEPYSSVRLEREVRSRLGWMAAGRWTAELPARFVVFAATRFAARGVVQALAHVDASI